MSDYINVPSWVRPGADVAVKRGATGGYYGDTVERLTPTLIIMASGERYRRKGLEAVQRGHWGTNKLVPANSPPVIEQAKNAAVDGMWSPLQDAMVAWRNGDRDETSREAALDAVRAVLADALARLHKTGSIPPYEETA